MQQLIRVGAASALTARSIFGIRIFQAASRLALAVFLSLGLGAAGVATASTLTISGTPAATVQVGKLYEFQAAASGGAPGSTLVFSIKNHPGWSTFNRATGQLTGIKNQTGTYSNILISVTDGVSTASLPAFTIRVTTARVDTGPAISGQPPGTVTAGQTYSFTPSATDTGGTGLSFSVQNKPGWASFSSVTGQLSGTPTSASVGLYSNISISASNGSQTAYLAPFSIQVTGSSGGASPPTISGQPATAVTVGSTYSFTPTTTDPSAGTLAFSITGKPSWASFNTSSGQLIGIPSASNVGAYPNIVISVSDGTHSASLAAFSIAVNAAAGSPTVSLWLSPQSIVAGASSTLTWSSASATACTASGAWSGAEATSGTISESPAAAGTYTYTLSCTGAGGSAANSAALTVSPATVASGAPMVLYTDVASGPNTGGENNSGAYLSIFGINFGITGLGSTVHVYIGGQEVSSYRYIGLSRGRPDIGQISVQVGALGNPTPGTALPIKVTVNGVSSNTDQTFMVNPGRMLFVSQSGNDSTAVAGDITHPYRHVANGSSGAFDVIQPGDTIVLRGTPLAAGAALSSDPTPSSSAWTDVYNGYFLRFIDHNGTAATGASGSGPLALIAYPNEDVYVYESYASGATGGISGVDTTSYQGGRYVTVADLRIEAGGSGGVVDEQVAGQYWRVVNNELTAVTGSSDSSNLEGGIVGNGTNSFWVGNHVHNINSASPQEMHGIYIDGDGSYEVAYNLVESVTDGTGFQVYTDAGSSSTTNNVSFHHNMIHDINKYGVNVADGSANGFVYYDNVVYNTGWGCLRFNTKTLNGAKIYNNTFYNCVTKSGYGVVNNDWNLPSGALDMENNILYAGSGGSYSGGSVGMTGGIGTVTNNLFYNGSGGDGWDSHPISGNPGFLSLTTPDFHLTLGSPAIGAGSTAVATVVTTDYSLSPRPATSIDIGAYVYTP